MAELKKQKTDAPLLRLYRTPALTAHASRTLQGALSKALDATNSGVVVQELQTEHCFYVETNGTPLATDEHETLHWLLSETFERQLTRPDVSFLEVRA